MRNSTGTKQLRSGRVITVKTVMDCSIVDRYRRQWDPCYFDEPAEEPYSACVDPALQKVLDAERDIEMKKVDDLCEQDPRPDLSATCGQATECPCPGCCKEQECAPDTRPDSAEIDHDDPINRR